MSFIDRALEKTKALKKKNEKKEIIPGPQEPAPGLLSAAVGTLPVEQDLVPQDISYTITHTVAVDRETMRRNRLIFSGVEGQEAVIEAYKVLRTHILHHTKAQGRNTLMVTGPSRDEGKTLSAINLAISIAQEINQTVLLVDADLRYPSVHRYFGIQAQAGLVDHLTAGVPISELLIHPEGLAKLVLLPGGRPTARAPELINSPTMKELVQELKHYYPNRYVIFDLPPLLTYADALAFAPLMDGIIVVVEAGETKREDIEQCQKMLEKFNLLGFVLNKMAPRDHGYQYYYRLETAPAKKFWLPWIKK